MKAAIDIGTNTVLLLIAKYKNGVLKPVYEEQRIPRLGKGVDGDRMINKEATERVLSALFDYKALLEQDYPEVNEVVITATSAVRDAKNRNEFIHQIKAHTGFELRLLSGNEEAKWTATGALSVLDISTNQDLLILDIGGGSTEVAQLFDTDIVDAHSYDMGSVRFTERFLKRNPPAPEEINECRDAIKNIYKERLFYTGESCTAIGVAGTLTTLVGITENLNSYQPEKLNGYKLSIADVEKVIDQFSNNAAERMLELHPVYLKGRADIFFAGMLILEGFLKQFHLNEILVSTGGIRHGAIIEGLK